MSLFTGGFSLADFISRLIALAVAITLHEFAHAWVAFKAGDDTAKQQGRMSLNPISHYDLIGSTMMIFFGFGWAKPVPIDYNRFRDPRWDSVRVSAAGPISNLILATLLGLMIRFDQFQWIGSMGPTASTFILLVVRKLLFMNLGLALFNLIPLPPLDGSHILSGLLPGDQARSYDRVMARWGFFILFGLIFLAPGVFGYILQGPMELFLKYVVGM